MKPEFVHLHIHSDCSLLDGMCEIGRLVKRTKELGMPALALTDHGNMFGTVEFYLKATEQGLKPIVGMEAYVAPGSRKDRSRTENKEASFHLTLLVKNERGYKNLAALSTYAFREGFYYKPRMDKELLSKHHEGLIALSGCPNSEFGKFCKAKDWDGAIRLAGEYADLFGRENYYLEVQRHGLDLEKDMTEGAVRAARALGLKIVATNDCHYIAKDDHEAHDVLLALNTGTQVTDPNRLKFDTPEFYIKSPEEMHKLFEKDLPESLRHTLEVAEKCNLELNFDLVHLPKYPVPDGKTDAEYLRDLCLEAHRKKYPDVAGDLHKRLDFELGVINKMGFASYFLIVMDFVQYAKTHGVRVGPGRGSAAGSMVSYLLGITDLDPIRYGLLFERFLNPERREMPDIDIDFAPEGRQQVIDYIKTKFGGENVNQIITYSVMKARAVIRDVARAMGLPLQTADMLAKRIPRSQILDIGLSDTLAQDVELRQLVERDEPLRKLWSVATRLENLRRHCGRHAGGVVISDKPITEYAPIYSKDGEEAIQYDMDSVQKLGLLKMDLLGVETLAVLDRAVKVIERTRGVKIDIDNLPLDDAKTYQMLSNGFVKGVFQLEISRAAREMIMRMKPNRIEDIIAAVALNRPGPMQSGMVDMYINRKHGREKVTYVLPMLEAILSETFGAILYQEQVMMIAHRMAGFTMAEADKLRKAMGKKIPELMEQYREKFIQGAEKNGVPGETAKQIFEDISKFASYGFNKSHSAAYGLISFRTAYLKANYPVEFMSVLMSHNLSDEEKLSGYLEECRRLDIQVLPPDVDRSEFEFSVEEGKIRIGLGAIKGAGERAINAMLEVRRGLGGFKDVSHFAENVDHHLVDKRVVEALIKAGAFDSLKRARSWLIANVESIYAIAESKQEEKKTGQISLFGSANTGISECPEFEEMPEWPQDILLRREKEALGFYITSNPVAKYQKLIELISSIALDALAEMEGGKELRVAGILSNINLRVVQSGARKGSQYVVFNISDLTGRSEAVMFERDLERNRKHLQEDVVVLLKGTVDFRMDEPSLIARDLIPIDDAAGMIQSLKVTLNMIGVGADALDRLKELLTQFPGPVPVTLDVYTIENRRAQLRLGPEFSISPSNELIEGLEKLVGKDGLVFYLPQPGETVKVKLPQK